VLNSVTLELSYHKM